MPMQASDKAQFVNLMSSVAELYRETLSLNRLEIYWRCLQKYSLESIRKTLDAHAVHPNQGQFMPKPADIIRLLEGNDANQSLLAWNKATDAMKSIGSYNSIIFDDSLIHRILLDMGGWIKFGENLEKELPFVEREFERRYRFYVWQKPLWHPKQLSGLFESTNTLMGYSFPSPKIFGDTQLALKVYQEGTTPSDQKILSLPQAMELIKHVTHQENPEQPSQEKQHDSENFNKDEKNKSISKN